MMEAFVFIYLYNFFLLNVFFVYMNTYICIFVYLFKYLYVSSGDNDSRRGR